VTAEWNIFPPITGLMITAIPARHDFARQAAKDFLAQDWPHKNLIIVNTTGLPLFKPIGLSLFKRTQITEISAATASSGLWEFGLSQCKGEWVADWQDDCRYSPLYLQALGRFRNKAARVSLLYYRGICLNKKTKVNVENNGQEFNLLFRFKPSLIDEPVWLDRTDLVTRYYASQINT